ncbi:hypothetical protein like AT4G03000 [Hibiscus trionum]|uniref:RING-type domain-containing protein n=1 Tax=Hibiscus trionum TaxID=183268 RepID=A0A9W7MCK0_HIBTR|nr:hypothetical protein like AT4G03000 [Hibiscus trionum]
MNEKNDSGDKGSKNKRKLDDSSLEGPDPVVLPLSMSEFPPYELAREIFRGPIVGPLEVGSSMGSLREDFVPADWEDPVACQLEELLLSNLHMIFRNAVKKIVECGFKEDVAEKAISRHPLYQGGKNLVSNVVNDALASLKEGIEGDISSFLFKDLQQLVAYTMLEMISVLREVKPCLSIVEAMWWLLMFDLNISVACEVEGDILRNLGCMEVSGESSSDSNSKSRLEIQNPETVIPISNEPNVSKPSFSSKNYQPEALKSGRFPNSPKPKTFHASGGLTPEKELLVSMSASGDNVSITSLSKEKAVSSRKGGSKKELAALREINRTYRRGFRTSKLAASCSVVEKRMKSPSELPAVHMKNPSSKIVTEAGALPNESHHVSANSSPGLTVADDSSTLAPKGTKSVVPTTNTGSAPSLSLENKPVSKSEGGTSKSSKTPEHGEEKNPDPKAEDSSSMSSKPIDYYAGIPYNESLGKYIPQDEKDDMILKLVPRLEELQNELDSWTQWTNQKVMQAARRLSKDKAELKSLRQEKEEAEQLKREKQIMEENTMKRLSEMEFALNNATGQVEDANSTVQKLEVENSLLKMEMEAAKSQATASAASFREALEREQKALKDVQSWEGQRSLLQEELALEKQKAAELQRKVGKNKNIYSQIEMTWKDERMAKEKVLAQAASIRKERERLEAATKVVEDKIKLKAEKDMQKYGEEIKTLEKKLSELKTKLDSSKIAALRGGICGGNGQCSSVNEGNNIPSFSKRERECVMCLSEEKVVVFLPCSHQVLCVKCNELHEKQQMKDCPACRTLIDCRICARFAKPPAIAL